MVWARPASRLQRLAIEFQAGVVIAFVVEQEAGRAFDPAGLDFNGDLVGIVGEFQGGVGEGALGRAA